MNNGQDAKAGGDKELLNETNKFEGSNGVPWIATKVIAGQCRTIRLCTTLDSQYSIYGTKAAETISSAT